MISGPPDADKDAKSQLRDLFALLDTVSEAAATREQQAQAGSGRWRVTAGLVAIGWRTRELAAIIGRSQSTICTWVRRGQDLQDRDSLDLPRPAAPRPELTSPADYVGVATAAESLGVDQHTVRNWIRLGRLPAVRISDSPTAAWRISKEDVNEYTRIDPDLSIADVAAWYCVSEQTARRWQRSGQLAAERAAQRGIYRVRPSHASVQ